MTEQANTEGETQRDKNNDKQVYYIVELAVKLRKVNVEYVLYRFRLRHSALPPRQALIIPHIGLCPAAWKSAFFRGNAGLF